MGNVQPHERKERADSKERIWEVLEGFSVEQCSGPFLRVSVRLWSHHRKGYQQSCEREESNNASGPREANLRPELAK